MRSLFERVSRERFASDSRHSAGQALVRVADILTLLMGLAAMVTLVGRYGFYLSPRLEVLAAGVSRTILYGFLGVTALRLLVATDRRGLLRSRAVDIVLAVLCLIILVFPGAIGGALARRNPVLTPQGIASVYVAITQVALAAAFVPGALRASRRIAALPLQPALIILLSFLMLALVGAGALMLPRATTGEPLRLLDALFMAVSAACVTGLSVVDIGTALSPLGKGVILVLLQVGGLGIMTLTTFFALMVGRRGSLKEYSTLQSILGQDSIGRIRGAAAQIALTTLGLELAGTVILYLSVGEQAQGAGHQRLFFSVFHSVSAFCNAGFSLLSAGLADPVFRTSLPALLTIMVLIVVGGLGFPVLQNLATTLLSRLGRRARVHLTLHTRLVLFMTISLLALGALVFALLERGGVLAGEPTGALVLHALFQSVTARTAGFNTVDITRLAVPTVLLMIVLMWVGASPGSTGGGIKTTTLALALLDTRAIARGQSRVQVGRIPVDGTSVARAHATITLSLILLISGFVVLAITERGPLLSLAFEAVSAAGTVGLSTGATRLLGASGKVVITILMFVGRVGFLTLAMAVTPRSRSPRVDYAAQSVSVL